MVTLKKVSKSKRQDLEWERAGDIKQSLNEILSVLDMPHVDSERIFCYRTVGSKSRSYARIWAFPKIFQDALALKPAYVIEVLSKHYDNLSDDDKKRVLIHELLHIPKNFSGALLAHNAGGKRLETKANLLFREYKEKR
jgi:predicted metallopeptidase